MVERRILLACPQGIEPLTSGANSYDFYRGLGLRLGQAEHWPWKSVAEVYDYCLEPVGLDFKQLEKQYGIFGKREYGVTNSTDSAPLG